jgi:hypothetical protein
VRGPVADQGVALAQVGAQHASLIIGAEEAARRPKVQSWWSHSQSCRGRL